MGVSEKSPSSAKTSNELNASSMVTMHASRRARCITESRSQRSNVPDPKICLPSYRIDFVLLGTDSTPPSKRDSP